MKEYVVKIRLDGKLMGWVGRCPFFEYRLVSHWWEAMPVDAEYKNEFEAKVRRGLSRGGIIPEVTIESVITKNDITGSTISV